MTVCQKVPILDFQSEFSMSKIIRIFLKKNFIEEYQFKRTFFVKIIFCWLQFQNHFVTKMTPNFWRTVTWCLMETKNLLISFDYSWFLAKNLAYAECLILKFHYRNSSTIEAPAYQTTQFKAHFWRINFLKIKVIQNLTNSIWFLQDN